MLDVDQTPDGGKNTNSRSHLVILHNCHLQKKMMDLGMLSKRKHTNQSDDFFVKKKNASDQRGTIITYRG